MTFKVNDFCCNRKPVYDSLDPEAKVRASCSERIFFLERSRKIASKWYSERNIQQPMFDGFFLENWFCYLVLHTVLRISHFAYSAAIAKQCKRCTSYGKSVCLTGSVCLSACLTRSRVGTVPRRMKIGSCNLHCAVAQTL